MPAAPWTEIARNARASLDQAGKELSDARDWLASDWPEGHGPADFEKKREAARMISEAKGLINQAKNALDRSAGR